MLGGNGRRPKRDAFGKRSFPSEARSAKRKRDLYYMLVAVIRPQSLPSAVFRGIRYYFTRLVVTRSHDCLKVIIDSAVNIRRLVRSSVKIFASCHHK